MNIYILHFCAEQSEFLKEWNETTIKDKKKEIQLIDKILKNVIRF